MDAQFWHERWEARQIGFHQDNIHVYLENFWPHLNIAPGTQVFVPLCGKSLDMLWLLEQELRVFGVELSPIAVAAFFSENGLTARQGQIKDFSCWEFGEVTLWCGDFFDLRPEQVAESGAVYDRASLIALPPAMRQRYAAHLADLLCPGTPILLVTLEYNQAQMHGPPFSVSAAEVAHLFGADFSIETLAGKDILAEESHFQSKGLTALHECAYKLIRY
jgi:thiopurine S-methyltransferase